MSAHAGVAAHLHHRESRDLDFFFHGAATVDLEALRDALRQTGHFGLTGESEGTLGGLYRETKVEIFQAGLGKPHTLLNEPTDVAGLQIGSLQDIMAMKLKAVGDRGELRDYFDLKTIEEKGHITIEEGLALYLQRFNITRQHASVSRIVAALGYLDDVEEDELLPVERQELAEWWKRRQQRLIRNLGPL